MYLPHKLHCGEGRRPQTERSVFNNFYSAQLKNLSNCFYRNTLRSIPFYHTYLLNCIQWVFNITERIGVINVFGTRFRSIRRSSDSLVLLYVSPWPNKSRLTWRLSPFKEHESFLRQLHSTSQIAVTSSEWLLLSLKAGSCCVLWLSIACLT